MMEKKYGLEANFEIVVNMEKGDIEIFLYKKVVDEVLDYNNEIDKESAKEKSGEEFEVGDDFVEEIPTEDFGRRMVINLKQNLNQKIREIEKEIESIDWRRDEGIKYGQCKREGEGEEED